MNKYTLTISHDNHIWQVGSFADYETAKKAFGEMSEFLIYANVNDHFGLHGARICIHDVERLKLLNEFTYYAPRQFVKFLGEK